MQTKTCDSNVLTPSREAIHELQMIPETRQGGAEGDSGLRRVGRATAAASRAQPGGGEDRGGDQRAAAGAGPSNGDG
ncbi:hypothetical protein Scep_002338 [Stephania cephalantha]|uniref:Uncharacterized protein n=1 Tax=Stephania cephalantha TaxID=152367 RepID=A0AAP0LB87_9MAGN